MEKMRYIIVLLCLSVAMFSCTDLIGTFEEWQGDGEINYTGKIDSLKVREGLHRIQFEGFLYYAETAKEVVIEWNDQKEVFSLEGYSKTDKLEVLLDDLEEDLYVFKVYTLDQSKTKSVVTTIQANVHGERFIAAQNPVLYSASFTESNAVEIIWRDMPRLARVVLDYIDNEGNPQQITVTKGNTVTSISGFKPGSQLKITTQVKPNEEAYEYIPIEPKYYDFPSDFHLDRSLFRDMQMASDAGQNHGGVVTHMWDGNDESYMHTTDGVGVPCHITIDTGESNFLTKGKVRMRSQFIWCPSEFQIWGLPEVDDINEHEPSVPDDFNNQEAWEAEAKAKGWVNLTDNGTTDYVTREVNNREVSFKLNNSTPVRYIRYRALKVWEREGNLDMTTVGYAAYFCTSELYLYRNVE